MLSIRNRPRESVIDAREVPFTRTTASRRYPPWRLSTAVPLTDASGDGEDTACDDSDDVTSAEATKTTIAHDRKVAAIPIRSPIRGDPPPRREGSRTALRPDLRPT